MTFSERMKELLDQGVAATKEFALKAGAKAQDLGERGIIMLEVKQLEVKAQKLLGRLGNEVYRMFNEQGAQTIERDKPEIDAIITELESVRDSIEQKEAELLNRNRQAENNTP